MVGKHRRTWRVALVLAGLHALLAGLPAFRTVAAQTATFQPLPFGKPIGGDVLRMLREVFPDLTADGTATRYAGVPTVPGAVDDEAVKPATGAFDLAADRMQPLVQAVLNDGAVSYTIVLAVDIVVVARTVPDYVYGGALFVRTDPGGPASIESAFVAAPDIVLVLVRNAHHNSQEAFDEYLLVGLVDGRLALLHVGPSLYSFSDGGPACDDRAVTQRLEGFRPAARHRHGYPDIALEVVEEGECRTAGKTIRPAVKRVSALLTWDAGQKKYVGDPQAFESLSRRPP
jgi:hypothetical protein